MFRECIAIKCDNCGKEYGKAFSSFEEANLHIIKYGWGYTYYVDSNPMNRYGHFCPKCNIKRCKETVDHLYKEGEASNEKSE